MDLQLPGGGVALKCLLKMSSFADTYNALQDDIASGITIGDDVALVGADNVIYGIINVRENIKSTRSLNVPKF